MAGPIQVVPPGLMGLLQLKTGGNLPGQLSDVVAGVLELRDWYMTARRVDELALFGSAPQVTVATGGNGFGTFTIAAVPVIVPQNQFWYVEQLTVNGTIATAADTIRFAPSVFNNGLQTQEQVGPDVADVVNARVRTISVAAQRGFWAFPGDTFGVTVFDILSAAGILLRLKLRATPLPA